MGTSLERWTTWEKKETQNNEDELQTNNYGSKSTLRHWLAFIANRNQTSHFQPIAIRYTPQEVCAKPQNVFHSQIYTSCASNYRRKEHFFLLI